MSKQSKFWAIATLVSLAIPGLAAINPEAAQAQAVCGNLDRIEIFETPSYRVSICDQTGSLAFIILDKRTGNSRWALASQNSWDSYSARSGSTEYFISNNRLTISQNGRLTDSEQIFGQGGVFRPAAQPPAHDWHRSG
ncbi:MAG: hypothetical protein HC838_14680, partial [Spirulinaceae cyanobacterium RM2_2_10]|nr:hypothetical protein [Spirulinaceae cyanobacterium RM2_2_10]